MVGKIDENGEQDWLSVAKTVKPLKGKKRVAAVSAPPKEAPKKAIAKKSTAPSKSSVVKPPLPQAAKPRLKPVNLDSKKKGGISRADAQKIKAGQISLAGRIDLHGQTSDDARKNVRNFIISHATTGPCTILVITGKGIEGKGIIRQKLPEWLNQDPIDEMVVAFCKAQPKDGGDGAFYLKLRP